MQTRIKILAILAIFLASSMLITPLALAQTRTETVVYTYPTGNTGDSFFTKTYPNTTGCAYMQTFYGESAKDILSVELRMWKQGTPTGILEARIFYIDEVTGIPFGNPILYSEQVTIESITDGWYNFTFADDFEMTSGIQYGIGIFVISGVIDNVANNIAWAYDDTSPTATGHSVYYNSGWVEDTTKDYLFTVYGRSPLQAVLGTGDNKLPFPTAWWWGLEGQRKVTKDGNESVLLNATNPNGNNPNRELDSIGVPYVAGQHVIYSVYVKTSESALSYTYGGARFGIDFWDGQRIGTLQTNPQGLQPSEQYMRDDMDIPRSIWLDWNTTEWTKLTIDYICPPQWMSDGSNYAQYTMHTPTYALMWLQIWDSNGGINQGQGWFTDTNYTIVVESEATPTPPPTTAPTNNLFAFLGQLDRLSAILFVGGLALIPIIFIGEYVKRKRR